MRAMSVLAPLYFTPGAKRRDAASTLTSFWFTFVGTHGARRRDLTQHRFYRKILFMKTTVEFPDDLMEEVKIEAARRRTKLKILVPELVRAGLASQRQAEAGRRTMTVDEATAWVARLRQLGREMDRDASDPRTLVQILNDDRR